MATFNSTAGTHSITASLSWVEPEEPNGAISTYEYSIKLEADPSVVVANGTTSATSVEPSVTVLAYVQYRFTVTAQTGGGLGTAVEEVVFSPEAGVSPYQAVNTILAMDRFGATKATHITVT